MREVALVLRIVLETEMRHMDENKIRLVDVMEEPDN